MDLNISRSGISTTLGPKGASLNIGKKGTHVNAGIPGTGLSSRTKISGPKASSELSPEGGKKGNLLGILAAGAIVVGLLIWLL